MNRLRFLTVLLPAAVATAQGVTLEAWTLGGGGAFAAAGNVELGGTLGAGPGGWQSAGTAWSTAGFWGALEEPPTSTAIAELTSLPGPERILLQWRAGTRTGWIVDRRAGTSPFARIGVVGPSSTGRYGLLDATPLAATLYTYLLSEQVAGAAIPRATIDASAYSLSLPPNMVRVGPGGLTSVQAAIAAAPPGALDWVVTIEPGTYPPFTVDATAPASLRIVADGTGPVSIDTATGPVRIVGRGAGQSTELHGLDIGSSSTAQNGLEIADSTDVVLVQHTTIAADPTSHVALDVRRSGAVALHRCDLSGMTGLVSVTARIAAGRTRTAGFDLSQGSRLTAAELDNRGAAVVDPTSQFGPLAGVMPEVGGPVFAVPDLAMTLRLETPPNAAWAVIVAAGNSWLELPPLEMPVLLDLTLSFTVGSGIAGPQGRSELPVLITGASTALFGASLPFQMLSIDAANGVLRMSNAATRIWLQ